MKIGVFADPHYCSAELLCRNRRPRLSFGKIKEALEEFRRQEVSLAVCMGDLTDRCETREEALSYLDELCGLIKASGLPFLNVPGNHDYLDFTAEELSAHGFRTPPYAEVWQGFRLIVLDANYRSDMRRFDAAGVEWTDAHLPPEQMEFLQKTLAASGEPCIVFVHECLDPTVEARHIIKNAEEVRRIIEQSGKVKLVLEGHYHSGADSVINGIRILTLPAMCEGEKNSFFILDIENDAPLRLVSCGDGKNIENPQGL